MLDTEGAGTEIEGGRAHVGTKTQAGGPSWREIDQRLRRVATARAGLDAEELSCLAQAERAQIHRHFGYTTILEYIERILGYGPRVARERLRLARALQTLPKLRAELAAARLSYSAVRELSRVVTPATEATWIADVAGCSLREIEQRVAGHAPGDNPDDPPDPDLAPRPITFELTPRTLALLRAATRRLEDEVGHPLEDDELIATMCASVLRAHVGTDDAGPPPYQVAVSLCPSCKRATHDAAGRSFDIPASTVEQALCNAQFLGRVDADAPARATRNVPPAVARMIQRRDGGRCVVPGCRSTRYIEVHHIHYWSRGGDHSPGNLACLCFAHHAALHEGRLTISGIAPDQLVFERIDPLLTSRGP